MESGFWWKYLKERKQQKNICVDESSVLKCITEIVIEGVD